MENVRSARRNLLDKDSAYDTLVYLYSPSLLMKRGNKTDISDSKLKLIPSVPEIHSFTHQINKKTCFSPANRQNADESIDHLTSPMLILCNQELAYRVNLTQIKMAQTKLIIVKPLRLV